jgi:hypothetical protein
VLTLAALNQRQSVGKKSILPVPRRFPSTIPKWWRTAALRARLRCGFGKRQQLREDLRTAMIPLRSLFPYLRGWCRRARDG